MNKGLRWKETIAGVEAPNLMVVETQLPAGRNQTFATPADIVACLKANPEAAGQVLLALESQYIAGETAKHIARASQAEQALATVTAERDEARVRERGWQWRPVGDGAFAPPFGTIRVCLDCGCLVSGGPTRCVRCAEPPATRAELDELRWRVERLEQLTGFGPKE